VPKLLRQFTSPSSGIARQWHDTFSPGFFLQAKKAAAKGFFPQAPCWAKPNVASQGFCPARFPQKKAVALEAGVNWNLLAKRFIKNEPA